MDDLIKESIEALKHGNRALALDDDLRSRLETAVILEKTLDILETIIMYTIDPTKRDKEGDEKE